MTVSIAARCALTGRFGVSIISRSLSVGAWCDGALRSNLGICLTQGHYFPGNNHLGMRLLAQGFTPEHVLSEILANDACRDLRQISVIGPDGGCAAFTGPQCTAWAGHHIGQGVVVIGDALGGRAVLEQTALAYERSADLPLDERLLLALETCMASAPESHPEGLRARSAAVIVYGAHPYSELDLRVDWHEDPVGELRRAYEEFKPYESYYIERGRNPHGAIPQREFADILTGNRQVKDIL